MSAHFGFGGLSRIVGPGKPTAAPSGRRGFAASGGGGRGGRRGGGLGKRSVPQISLGGNDDVGRLERLGAEDMLSTRDRIQRGVSALKDIEARKGEDEAVARARGEASSASDRDAAQFERATRGFDLTGRQQRAAGQRIGLSRAISQADRTGAVRRDFTDRSKLVRQVGGGFADALFNQRASGETDIANIFGQKEAARKQRKGQKKSSLIGTLGGIAGLALKIFSSEAMKDKRGPTGSLLGRLKKVRVENWNYKGSDINHIGPYAEEFNDAFGVGQNDRGKISVVDVMGITLGAVKELSERMEAHV